MQCLRFLRAHQPSTRISVEVEKPGRYGLQELAAEADVVFYSKNWALVGSCSGSPPPFELMARRAKASMAQNCFYGPRQRSLRERKVKYLVDSAGLLTLKRLQIAALLYLGPQWCWRLEDRSRRDVVSESSGF